jgi:prolyl oligopeptidase
MRRSEWSVSPSAAWSLQEGIVEIDCTGLGPVGNQPATGAPPPRGERTLWLIQNKYTQPARLGISGGSNGGLLMGAMMTQRPDLFGAIVCGAPLLDMLRFHKMSVGAWWTAEYGSVDDPNQFTYLYKYSPYHNVKKGTRFPAILFMSGDFDTRVDPSHARKMTALVQAANSSGNPILLRYDTKGGHSGIANVSKTVEEDVDRMSFLAARLGMKSE